MTHPATQAFARATAALVNHRDVTDSLTSLLSDAQDVMSAAALGLLLHTGDGSLEVLTATSHAAVVLELFQAQQQSGPCVDASRTNSVVAEDGAENIVARWPVVGAAIVAAGHESVRAYPMQWHAHRLGPSTSSSTTHCVRGARQTIEMSSRARTTCSVRPSPTSRPSSSSSTAT